MSKKHEVIASFHLLKVEDEQTVLIGLHLDPGTPDERKEVHRLRLGEGVNVNSIRVTPEAIMKIADATNAETSELLARLKEGPVDAHTDT